MENNIGKPKELWKTLKSLGFSKTEVSASKTCLEREGKLSFDPKENSEIFKDFFSKLATNLVNKLPPAPKKFGMDTVEAYYRSNITSTASLTFSEIEETVILNLHKSINPAKAACQLR